MICECGRNIYIPHNKLAHGCSDLSDHDLCQQCYRRMRAQNLAALQGVKPEWAIRATLRVMAGLQRVVS